MSKIIRSGIYEIVCTATGKKYIGSAINLKIRLAAHKRALLRKNHINRHLQNAWNKYGENAFKFNVLLYSNKINLLFYEQRAIDIYKTTHGKGYNVCIKAGSVLGRKLSDEHKKKISTSEKGKVVSEETKAKLSSIFKGWKPRPFTKEHRANMSKARMGVPLSNEHKKKLSKAKIGKKRLPFTEETKRKMSEAQKGKTHTQETKTKISKAKKGCIPWNKGRKGTPLTEELKLKLAERMKGNSYRKGVVSSLKTKKKQSASLKKAWEKRRLLFEHA